MVVILMRKIFYVLLLFFAAVVVSAEKRQVWLVDLAFIDPVIGGGGSTFGHRNKMNSNDLRNFPLPLAQIPKSQPKKDSAEERALVNKFARIHLELMKKIGVDTVLYDMLPVPDYDPTKPLDSWNTPFARFPLFLDRLKIAGELGLKMAIFADVANLSSRYPKRRVLTVDEWIKVLDSALKMSANHSAYQQVNGLPLLVHFGTDSFYENSDAPDKTAPLPDCGWREILAGLRKKEQRFYFVADIRPSRIDWMWDDIADGAYLFSPSGPTEFLVEYQRHTMKRLKKIPFFWSVSSGNMREGKHYTQPDFGRIHAIYDAAIRAGVSTMILTTWNDLNEDHDIWPSCNKGSELLEIFRFYNRWFKSGRMPEIEEEKIVLAWPLRSPEKITSFSGQLWSRLLPESPGSKIITEAAPPYNVYRKEQFYPRIFFWSLLKKPRTLELCGRKYALPVGVYFGSCVFDLGRNPKRIPVTARVSGDTIELPAIQRVPVEFKDGGLEHRYFDLLRKPACNLLTGRRLDVANAAAAKGKLLRDGKRVKLQFQLNPGKHNWVFLRSSLPENAVPRDARFVKISYRGELPSGLKAEMVFQQKPDDESYVCTLPPPGREFQTRLIPLNHFKPASWNAGLKQRIPTPGEIRYVNFGAGGTPERAGSAELEVKELVFLQ